MYKFKMLLLMLFIAVSVQLSIFASKEFTGTVKSLNVAERSINYDAAYEGEFGRSVNLGTIGIPSTTHLNNDEVIEGEALYEFKLPYWESMVEGYQYLTRAAKIEADNQQIQLNRYNKLVKPGAVSEQDRETHIGYYIDSVNSYLTNQAMIANKYENVREAVFRPPFEGIVTKIYQSTGLATGGKIMEFTQLNPIGIDIKMERNEARKLSGLPVKIYPIGVNKPQGILYGMTMLTDDGVTFITENYPLSTLQNPDLKIQVHRNCGHVFEFDVNNQIPGENLAVPINAVQKEGNDYYVWKAAGTQDLQPDKGLDMILTVNKVKIVPEDLFRKLAGTVDIQLLKDPGSLKLEDIVIINPPKDLKDGDKLFFPGNRYVFMPGEEVKVVIGN